MGIKKWMKNGNDCTVCRYCLGVEVLDCDSCGCFLRSIKEIKRPCRIPLIIRKLRNRRNRYLWDHMYDNIDAFLQDADAKESNVRAAIEKRLKKYSFCRKGVNGEWHEANKNSIIFNMTFDVCNAYEEVAQNPHKSLPQKWKELFHETIFNFYYYIKSYIVGGSHLKNRKEADWMCNCGYEGRSKHDRGICPSCHGKGHCEWNG